MKREILALSPSIPHFTLSVQAERTDDSMIAEGWIQDKPCLVTIDISMSVTIGRPAIIAGLPEGKLSWPHLVQVVSGRQFPS